MRPIVLQGHERPLTQIKYNAEGDLLFSCSKDYVISVWSSHNGERIGTYDGHNGSIWTVDVDSKSRFLVSGSADNTLRLWNVSSGECLYTWEFSTAVKWVAFSEDDTQVVCITEQRMGHPCSIRVFNIEREGDGKNQSQVPLYLFNPIGSKARACAFTLIPNILITGHESGKVALFNVQTGEEIASNERAHSDSVMDLQLSKDRTYCITASRDKTARIHDTKKLNGHQDTRPYVLLGGGLTAMTIAMQAKTNFDTRFWHQVYEEEVGHVGGHFGPINTIAVHPEGTSFATGSEDGFVRVLHFDDSYFKAQPYGAVKIDY
ncbi:Eukaryotic translation initiation factor 3 subunit I [Mycena sanguinolenta]|uniref:Eukaryotic translation initiation factor 3 subunit I n=1 Tax=Mycena sanguinolenta TaxID=230812 RepID=A0A8H6Z149_9AGAR|nr:Eukaryotic translation initiation factor 3 subunit I [Mycena sanguinolenta]